MPRIPLAMAVTSPGSIIPRKKSGALPSFFFLKETTGRLILRKEHRELVTAWSVIV